MKFESVDSNATHFVCDRIGFASSVPPRSEASTDKAKDECKINNNNVKDRFERKSRPAACGRVPKYLSVQPMAGTIRIAAIQVRSRILEYEGPLFLSESKR